MQLLEFRVLLIHYHAFLVLFAELNLDLEVSFGLAFVDLDHVVDDDTAYLLHLVDVIEVVIVDFKITNLLLLVWALWVHVLSLHTTFLLPEDYLLRRFSFNY